MSDTSIYDALVATAAGKYQVPAEWIKAVIGAESSFDPNVADRWESKVSEYAYGPMQILLSTARGLGFTGTGAQLRQPAANIDVGAAYLARLRSQLGEDFRRIYSAYNSGNADRWETSSQVRANVERALGWLEQFEPAGVGVAAIAAALVAAWWWTRRKGRRL